MASAPRRLRWLTAGDINGFLGLVVDNLSIMAFIAMALVGLFGFPADLVYTRMFPGTALGVLIGNLAYTLMARRLARQSGRDDVTAMPLGLDAPSSIGLALLLLGPAFLHFKQTGLSADAAALLTWHTGMAAMVLMGLLKLVLAFAGPWVQRKVPRAGLLGSIAGIALVLMGFLPLLEIMKVPVVGFTGLGIVLYALVARGKLPFGLPGVLVAFLVGTLLYYVLGPLGWLGSGYQPHAALQWRLALPWPSLGWWEGMAHVGPYLPLVLPFGLLVVVGGINVNESARASGDEYSTRDILLVEAVATLIAGVCGGVAQTTPYIGQPSYKAMGARTSYTLITGLIIGLGGMLGYLSTIVELLPLSVLAPILVFVAIGITTQSFEATPSRYAAAVVFSFFPPIARMLTLKLSDPTYLSPEHFAQLFHAGNGGIAELAVVTVLGNGFIITSMIWASFVVAMIDGRLGRAALILLLGAVLTACGIIHSVLLSGGVYLPWDLPVDMRSMVWQFSGAYLTLAVVLLLLSLRSEPRADPSPADAI